MPDIGYKSIFKNVTGPGIKVLAGPIAEPIVIHGLALTVDAAAKVRFGHKLPADPPAAAVQASADFYLLAGTPLVLPFTEDGWFAFPEGVEILVAITGAGADVGVQFVYARAGVE